MLDARGGCVTMEGNIHSRDVGRTVTAPSASSTTSAPDGWNASVAANPDGGAFFQLAEFAEIKADAGWRPRFVDAGGVAVMVLERIVPPLGRLWYVPQGPGLAEGSDPSGALTALAAQAKKRLVFAIKFEPQLVDSPENRAALEAAGAHRTTDVQPTFSTVWLDIRPDAETLLKGFDSKARYNIRRAVKDGVTTAEVPIDDASCRTFYDLFVKTAEGRFVIRPYEYYRTFWQTYGRDGRGAFFFAYYEGEVISADFVMINGHLASRKDAASVPVKKVRGAAALLVLDTIKALKERGVTDYDLCGAPPSDRAKDETHPLYGVGQFKTGFNKEITDYVGTWLLPVMPLQAKAWEAGVEKAVRKAHFVVKKTPYF